MKAFRYFVGTSIAFFTIVGGVSVAQNTGAPGVPVSVIITAEPAHGKAIPNLSKEDIAVLQGKDKRPVSELTPLGQQNEPMQLLMLISDSARGSFGTEINTLRQFVNTLPASTEIGIGYMRNGTNQMASGFTRDHASAANAIRLTAGGGGADVSPYDSLSEAIKNWPKTAASRREVIMISSGVEGLGGGFTSDNPFVDRAISDAQKAGVVVYTIYTPGLGHAGHGYWRSTWGQNFLSQLSDETGGESYMIGFGAPVSFQPFLQAIAENLKHQYRLTFEAKPEKKAGLQPFRVQVIEKNASLAAPDRVFVKAGV
jgi:VWFA-related protein